MIFIDKPHRFLITYLLILYFCLQYRINAKDISSFSTKDTVLLDISRNREIPITIYKNTENHNLKKQLVIINPGYGIDKNSYSFIANRLANAGYLVVAINHDLSSDEPLAMEGNLYELRKTVWERGTKNILFVIDDLKKVYINIDYQKLILIGHSNGGDIAMLFVSKYPDIVSTAITLDHRRMPIPRINKPLILSIRADEFEPDKFVIPDSIELGKYNIKILKLQNVNHMELTDSGKDKTKEYIAHEIEKFIKAIN